jgi:hypothetical protein
MVESRTQLLHAAQNIIYKHMAMVGDQCLVDLQTNLFMALRFSSNHAPWSSVQREILLLLETGSGGIFNSNTIRGLSSLLSIAPGTASRWKEILLSGPLNYAEDVDIKAYKTLISTLSCVNDRYMTKEVLWYEILLRCAPFLLMCADEYGSPVDTETHAITTMAKLGEPNRVALRANLFPYSVLLLDISSNMLRDTHMLRVSTDRYTNSKHPVDQFIQMVRNLPHLIIEDGETDAPSIQLQQQEDQGDLASRSSLLS